mgnify:CR=1 FL=1
MKTAQRALPTLLRALPEDAWAATPDVDELYHYPCASLPRLIEQGIDLFCGYMEDMLADSGGLERLRAQPDIQAQDLNQRSALHFASRHDASLAKLLLDVASWMDAQADACP